MPRRTAAQRAQAAVGAVIKQRNRAQAELDQLNNVLGELGVVIGPAQQVSLPQELRQAKPLMAGERAAPIDGAPKKSLEQMIAEARRNPIEASNLKRAPFVHMDERSGAQLSAEGVAPADQHGPGRWE